MLSLFKNHETETVMFSPELAMYRITDEADQTPLIHIRLASGDHKNTHKNIRINANSIQSISFEISKINDYVTAISKGDEKFVEFKGMLVIVRFDGTTEKHILADHVVAVRGQFSKKRNNKNISWPEISEVEEEINKIWQEIFAKALSGYLNIDEEIGKPTVKKERIQKNFNFSSLINYALIAVVTYTVIVLSYNWIKGDNNNVQTQNTALEVLAPDEINKRASMESADDLVMEEFGLEPGLNLDQ